jgi:hypothetical protein
MAALIPSASVTGSGTMTLAGPSTNSNQTITIPDATGTMMVSGNMPAFSVYRSTAQSISNGTWSKVQFPTEEFDTAGYYDNATNYRFLPLIAGYYQISLSISFQSSGNFIVNIYKNGSEAATGPTVGISGILDSTGVVSKLIYFNGTTDYVEGYCYQNSGGALNTTSKSNQTWFTGILIRSA